MSIAIKFEAEAKYPIWIESGKDYKAWAKRIVFRAERGDKTISVLQLNFAKEALNVEVN